MNILQAAQALLPELSRWRQHLHQHPEPSFEEWETQRYLLTQLKRFPELRIRRVAQTGLIADLITVPAGPWIALRADMDALPITEQPERPYRSLREGYMHACGHDAHMAILLGTIQLLYERRGEWQGAVRFIFQPGEEKSPGGASLLVQEGILSEVPIQAIWGLHVTPQLPVGTVGLRAGAFMAASDEVYIRLRGAGGHAAYPHLTADPIAVGASLLTQLQMLVSRAADPRSPTVLTFGRFCGGTAPNVIPTEVEIAGTLRTFDESWRRHAKSLLVTLVQNVSQTWNLTAEVDFRPGYPVLHNDPTITEKTRLWLTELLGAAQVQEMPLWLSSEDFAFYSQQVPACFIRLGTAGKNPDTHRPVHTPDFDIDESALPIGVAALATVAIQGLRAFAVPPR
ncbi:MAG: M20 family metallopeptidase [Bacteroidia bacterium]|nr:M20 family metallopeptidase [Bacteroidia bacterium]MCX7763844.1 M20 family metallopeptidase [Bacteroidia bacterium]MDW8056678.1 M20 family metallopeptidase [Bacteroidia bacterium]